MTHKKFIFRTGIISPLIKKTKASLPLSEMDELTHFYIKYSILAECLILQDIGHLQHFSELINILILCKCQNVT